jgi:hypothetical protein
MSVYDIVIRGPSVTNEVYVEDGGDLLNEAVLAAHSVRLALTNGNADIRDIDALIAFVEAVDVAETALDERLAAGEDYDPSITGENQPNGF